MDEKIFLRFQHGDEPMEVESLDVAQGVVFKKPKDASPLNLAFGLQSLLPGRLDPVRLRHDWRNKEFELDIVAEDGGIQLSGFDGDREGLPFGTYDLNVEVESYRFEDSQLRIVLKDGQRKDVLIRAMPDPRKVKLRDNLDAATAALIDNSKVEGQALLDWLGSNTPRSARQACLLNILTKLAAPPMPNPPKKSLTGRFDNLYFSAVDRIYAAVNPGLEDDLKAFVKKDGWVLEGKPKAPIHQRLVDDLLKRFKLKGKSADDFSLVSYRQGGRTCLQIVLAIPKFDHPVCYADVDIDLGNPLWDLDGVFVHLGELLDSGPTDHFRVREKLNQGSTKDFVFYDAV